MFIANTYPLKKNNMLLMIETNFCSSGVFNLIEIIANFPKLKKNWSEMARV